jgi:hypothetical protein
MSGKMSFGVRIVSSGRLLRTMVCRGLDGQRRVATEDVLLPNFAFGNIKRAKNAYITRLGSRHDAKSS